MSTDKQDKGNEVEMEVSETILLSTSTGKPEVIPKLLPSTITNHDTPSNVPANVDDAVTSRPMSANKYLNTSSGPFVAFIEGRDKNVANLHPIHIGKRFVDEVQVVYKPTKLIYLTFQGQLLPDRILIYKHYFHMKPKIQWIIQCAKCCRFGFSDQIFRSNKLCCPRCGEDHSLAVCSAPIYHCPNCPGPHSGMDRDHCCLWTPELNIKYLMGTKKLTHRQAKLQLSHAPIPRNNMTLFSPHYSTALTVWPIFSSACTAIQQAYQSRPVNCHKKCWIFHCQDFYGSD
ncbi:hypothetical protein PR048_009091 [Dryococelus australis]|uniref:Uncharacterized protein n=1 Tax=Dryococelus australis TaxID=614101 RepID=A0ABQ9HYY2_9NEOP|nr:hypothetical protein PR048_009091 [Dryococelus australis]